MNNNSQEMIRYFGYTSCTKVKDKEYWTVRFFNKITGNSEFVGRASSEEDAKLMLGKKQYEFYSKHPRMLPKFINANGTNIPGGERTKPFSLCIPNPCGFKTTIHIGFFTTIQDAIWAKKNLVARLVE